MTTRRRLLLALLAAVAVVISWRLRDASTRSSAPDDEAADPADAARPPPTLASAPQAKDSARPAGNEPASPSSDPAGAEARPTISVRGRVRVPGGDVPPEAIVYITGHIGRETRYLTRTTPKPDGSFALEAEAPDGRDRFGVTVGAWIPGRPRAEQNVTVLPPIPAEVVLEVPDEGGRLVGRVATEDGRPLAGLRVLVISTTSSSFTFGALPDPVHERTTGGWSSSVVTEATTDASGRVEATGINEYGLYALVSLDESWWLDIPNGFVTPKTGEASVTAHPAFRVAVEVAAAAADDPIVNWPSLSVVFETQPPASKSNSSIGTGSGSSSVVFRGPVPKEARAGFPMLVSADTRLHRPTTATLTLSPPSWRQEVRLALERKAADEIGTVLIFPGVSDREAKPVRPQLLTWRQTGERSKSGDWVELEARPDGSFAGLLPTGRREVEVHLGVPLRNFAVWKGAVEVAPGTETVVRPVWPPYGSALVRLGRDRSVTVVGLVEFVSGDGKHRETWNSSAKNSEFFLPFVPAGRWTATWQNGQSPYPSATFDVVAGVTTTVDVPP